MDRAEARPRVALPPQSVVAIFDATNFGEDTLLRARALTLKSNLAWAWIESETKEVYTLLRKNIESRGFTLSAVVLNGRTGIPRVFSDIPVQDLPISSTADRAEETDPATGNGSGTRSPLFGIHDRGKHRRSL